MKLVERVGLGVGLLFVLFVWAGPAKAEECPNEAVRVQQDSTHLPDCRAYELVTPTDTAGRLAGAINTFNLVKTYELFPTELASSQRDSFVYMTEGSPLRAPGGANGNWDVYQALRTSEGWETIRRMSLGGAAAVSPRPGGVSEDHLYAFSGPEGTGSYLVNPDGTFELTGQGNLGEELFAQGRYLSQGGEHVIFTTGQDDGQSFWCDTAGSACKV